MLVAFFLLESFKQDLAAPVVPVTAYATRVRRTLIDFAGQVGKRRETLSSGITPKGS